MPCMACGDGPCFQFQILTMGDRMTPSIEPLIFEPVTQLEILLDWGYSLKPPLVAVGMAYGIYATEAAVYVTDQRQ